MAATIGYSVSSSSDRLTMNVKFSVKRYIVAAFFSQKEILLKTHFVERHHHFVPFSFSLFTFLCFACSIYFTICFFFVVMCVHVYVFKRIFKIKFEANFNKRTNDFYVLSNVFRWLMY
jgi:hypothetical protein